MSAGALPRHILRSVEKPARYTGGEWNSRSKDLTVPPVDGRDWVRFAFCFPDLYELGMSNVALRIIYHLLNERPDCFCERAFQPADDMREALLAEGLPLTTLESGSPLKDFDFLGFTLQYEMSYPTILDMLHMGGVPLRSADRGEGCPFVVAGGPVVYNCEPVVDFFDIVMIGEGEELLQELLDTYQDWRQQGLPRRAFLEAVAQIQGMYVPAFYDCDYAPDGMFLGIRPNNSHAPQKVQKRIIEDFREVPYPSKSLVPNLEIVHDRAFLELFRGCGNGCRFCQAGMIYRPVREKSPEQLLAIAKEMLEDSGYDEIGLLSLSTGDYSALPELTHALVDYCEPRHINLSLPSLRLNSVSFELLERVSSTRKAGLTFAPEAGTQRLRDAINKNIQTTDLTSAAAYAFAHGWNRLKLYFMLGLPGETPEDVDGIAVLARQVLDEYFKLAPEVRVRKPQLTISTSFFIPKPWTSFQWVPQARPAEMQEQQKRLADLLRSRYIEYQWHDISCSIIEGVLARGDRRLSKVIERVWQAGGHLESWTQGFSEERWLAALAAEGLTVDFYVYRERSYDEALPWDHIDCGVKKNYLRADAKRGSDAQAVPDCYNQCSGCGAQNFGCGVCTWPRTAGKVAHVAPEHPGVANDGY